MTVLSQMFSKLKAKPQKSLEEQLAELDQLPIEVLVKIARGNESTVLRLAAIARLDYDSALIELAFGKGIASVRQKARQRLAELADQGAINLDQLASDGVDLVGQLAVAGFCQQDDLLEQLLNSGSDEDFLYQMALKGVSIRLRQLAAEKIEDEALLKNLLKKTKGRDKQVYKIAKRKCDGFRYRDQLVAQTQVEIISLCERLEAHSKRSFDIFYVARNRDFQDRWAAIASQASEPMVARIQLAASECQKKINAAVEQQANIEARRVAIAGAMKDQGATLDKLRSGLAHLFDCPAADEELQMAQELLDDCRQGWLGAAQHHPVPQSDEKTFRRLEDGVEFQLQQLRQHGSLRNQLSVITSPKKESHTAIEKDIDNANIQPKASDASGYDDLVARVRTANLLPACFRPQQLLDALALIAVQEKKVSEKKKEEKHRLRQLSALVRKAQSAIDSGQSTLAAVIRRAIDEKRSELKVMPAYLSRQLEQADTALEKLSDWKDYVVEPKRKQLIEQMRTLVDSQQNPEALATEISRLQDEWKELSKGTQDQGLWEKFHQLSQQAYKPCKIFFDEQAKIRGENLEKRIQMVAQLQAYLATQQYGEKAEPIDLSSIEELLTTAIAQWRSYAPFERVGNKPVQKEFNSVLDAIRTKLNEQRQKNADIKRQLIDETLKLVGQEDNRKAVKEVKRLQSKWKLTGTALRKDEQALWKTFRRGCDAIFEKRQQQTVEFKAELAANKNAALALLREVNTLLEFSGKALLDARARVVECQAEYRAVGKLPKAKENSLNQAFDKSIEQFDNRVSLQLQASKEQVWLNYLAAANKIRLYQIAEDKATAIVLEQEAREYIAGVEQWPKNGLDSLERKMARGAGDAPKKENEQALRQLCIRAEILCDLSTPDEDRSLRMQYQMARLEQGLGQKTLDKDFEMKAMVFEWVVVGPVSTVIYEPLLKRFRQGF
jgi:hypothetical protein